MYSFLCRGPNTDSICGTGLYNRNSCKNRLPLHGQYMWVAYNRNSCKNRFPLHGRYVGGVQSKLLPHESRAFFRREVVHKNDKNFLYNEVVHKNDNAEGSMLRTKSVVKLVMPSMDGDGGVGSVFSVTEELMKRIPTKLACDSAESFSVTRHASFDPVNPQELVGEEC